MNDYIKIICDAINNRHRLKFTYNGCLRIADCYACGLHATTQKPTVRIFQHDGESNSNHKPFLRLMTISEIQDLEVLPETFNSIDGLYRKGDKHLSPIYAEI